VQLPQLRIPPRLQPLQGCAPQVRVSTQGPAPGEVSRVKELLTSHPSTPINVSALAAELSSHPDYLLSGLSQGFWVGVVSPLASTYVSQNLQSALKDPAVVSKLLKKEVDKGYVIGPFKASPFSVFRSSPLGIDTKKYTGKKRLIFDPHTGPTPSINSLIPSEPFSLHYSTVDNAIKLIKLAGQGAWLSKTDIVDALKTLTLNLNSCLNISAFHFPTKKHPARQPVSSFWAKK